MWEHVLPKHNTRVRFPPPAQFYSVGKVPTNLPADRPPTHALPCHRRGMLLPKTDKHKHKYNPKQHFP